MADIKKLAQEAHDDFVRDMQNVHSMFTKLANEALDKFHAKAKEIDAEIQAESKKLATAADSAEDKIEAKSKSL